MAPIRPAATPTSATGLPASTEGNPRFSMNELGHGTKAAMVFWGREDDTWRRGNRGAEPLTIPWVWMARECQRQRAGIEDDRIDTAVT